MGREVIDISKWNDNINWDVLAPQLGLAICRVQYGSNLKDRLYDSFVRELEARGVPHAAYAYGCFVSVADAIVEADDFMKRVSPNAKFLVLDTEDDTLKSCGPTNIAAASQAFIDRCKSKGWMVGFYVSHHMYEKYGLNKVKADFLWIPRYGGPEPKYKCDIWQYADGETGGWMNGVGKVDRNKLMGDKTLEWYISGGKTNQIAPPPVNNDNVTSLGGDYSGKQLKCKANSLRFYNRPSWADADVAGTISKDEVFPKIVEKLQVGDAFQYKVQNSAGATFYITASDTFVEVVGSQAWYIGKRVESIVDQLNFYSQPTWDKSKVAGVVLKGQGFTIIGQVDVDGSPQYKVQNSKGAVFYITASEKFVKVV